MKKRHLLIGGLIVLAIGRTLGSGETHDSATSSPITVVETVNASPPSSLSSSPALPLEPQINQSEPSKIASLPKDTSKPVSPPTLQSSNLAARFIQGSGVALREAPSGQGKIIDRFNKGRKVGLVEPGETWSRVRDELTQKEGWIATRFLADAVRHPEDPRKDTSSPQKLPEPKVPVIPETAIIQRIIAFSIGNYSGSCACPYSTDRGGRKCGSRSAYSKPGGYSPICYPQDVTASMIEAFRRQ